MFAVVLPRDLVINDVGGMGDSWRNMESRRWVKKDKLERLLTIGFQMLEKSLQRKMFSQSAFVCSSFCEIDLTITCSNSSVESVFQTRYWLCDPPWSVVRFPDSSVQPVFLYLISIFDTTAWFVWSVACVYSKWSGNSICSMGTVWFGVAVNLGNVNYNLWRELVDAIQTTTRRMSSFSD